MQLESFKLIQKNPIRGWLMIVYQFTNFHWRLTKFHKWRILHTAIEARAQTRLGLKQLQTVINSLKPELTNLVRALIEAIDHYFPTAYRSYPSSPNINSTQALDIGGILQKESQPTGQKVISNHIFYSIIKEKRRRRIDPVADNEILPSVEKRSWLNDVGQSIFDPIDFNSIAWIWLIFPSSYRNLFLFFETWIRQLVAVEFYLNIFIGDSLFGILSRLLKHSLVNFWIVCTLTDYSR